MYEQAQMDSERSWGQSSLRTLKIAAIVFGIVLVLVVIPKVVAALYIGLTGILAVAIWKGRGWIRAFSVGALLPHLSGYLLALTVRRPSELLGVVLGIMIVSCVSGIAAAALHGVLVRRNGTLPIPDLPLLRDWFTNDLPEQATDESRSH